MLLFQSALIDGFADSNQRRLTGRRLVFIGPGKETD
jgi:hypothetical protein